MRNFIYVSCAQRGKTPIDLLGKDEQTYAYRLDSYEAEPIRKAIEVGIC